MLTEYEGHKIAYEGQTYNATANTVSGTAISGNPINWYNGTSYTSLSWKNGRQLASIRKGTTTYTYAYDMNGIRSSKTVNGVKHNYITQDGKVIREEYGTTVLEFVYDTNGAPYALRYSSDSGRSWMTYYYVLNLQGDVVKLLYADGSIRAEYTYNAWGEILSATNPSTSTVNIQDINPLRYRGYYYDTETGFYYLESRFYDPIVKRFINADSYTSTGQGIIGNNMFVYCGNNPVRRTDASGNNWLEDAWNWVSGAAESAWTWTCDKTESAWNWACGAVDDIKEWVNSTFSIAVYESESFEVGTDSIAWGTEAGSSTTSLIAGKDGTPVVFYLQVGTSRWKFWEYEIGISVGSQNDRVGIGYSVSSVSASYQHNDVTYTGTFGPWKSALKQSQSKSYGNTTQSVYSGVFVRPFILAPVVVTACYFYITTGGPIPSTV